MPRPDEPQATNSMVLSRPRISFAAWSARRAYSSAGTCPACHGPSISLPRHQILTPYGSLLPLAARLSDQQVPVGRLQYSNSALASAAPFVPRFMAIMGDVPSALH